MSSSLTVYAGYGFVVSKANGYELSEEVLSTLYAREGKDFDVCFLGYDEGTTEVLVLARPGSVRDWDGSAVRVPCAADVRMELLEREHRAVAILMNQFEEDIEVSPVGCYAGASYG